MKKYKLKASERKDVIRTMKRMEDITKILHNDILNSKVVLANTELSEDFNNLSENLHRLYSKLIVSYNSKVRKVRKKIKKGSLYISEFRIDRSEFNLEVTLNNSKEYNYQMPPNIFSDENNLNEDNWTISDCKTFITNKDGFKISHFDLIKPI